MTANLAHALLYGLAGYGIVNLIGDIADRVARTRRPEPLAGVHDFANQRAALQPGRANPGPKQRPAGPPRAMRSTDR